MQKAGLDEILEVKVWIVNDGSFDIWQVTCSVSQFFVYVLLVTLETIYEQPFRYNWG